MAIRIQRDPSVLRITYIGDITSRDVDSAIAAMRATLDARRPFGIVVDTRESKLPGAVERRMLAGYMKQDSVRAARYVCGCAIVAASALVRGVMSAMSWIARPVFATEYFPAPDDADRWVLGLLSKRMKLAKAG
jgi:hypothetical protein